MFSKTDRSATVLRAHTGVLYIDLIADISRKRQTRNYLEIGVAFGQTLGRVACDTAIGVDPAYALAEDVTKEKRRTLLHRMTSDRFFAEVNLPLLIDGGIDLAFLDGLHQFEFLLRDFANTEAHSNPNGLILMHDCMPINAAMAGRDPSAVRSDGLQTMWTGDVWKIVPILHKHRPDLDVFLVDCPPTGLVCVTGLDPKSRILQANYLDIVREFREVESNFDAISAMYSANSIVASEKILRGQDHSLFFRL